MKYEHPCFTVREDNNKHINVRSTTLFDALTWCFSLVDINDTQQYPDFCSSGAGAGTRLTEGGDVQNRNVHAGEGHPRVG